MTYRGWGRSGLQDSPAHGLHPCMIYVQGVELKMVLVSHDEPVLQDVHRELERALA